MSADSLILTFDGGTPRFDVFYTQSSTFTAMDGGGGIVNLKGSSGVLIAMYGFRWDVQNYSGQTTFLVNGPVLQEVREIGDFQGTVGWAAGVSGGGCAQATVGPSSMTFRFVADS